VGGRVFRKLVHRDYLIFYRVLTDRVEIDHILHGARDWMEVLRAGS
jgi:toxin ParE1/3/4